MTIRLDEQLGALVAVDDNGALESIAPVEELFGKKKAEKKAPVTGPRYEVWVMGKPVFRSNRVIGDRIRELVTRGIPPQFIRVKDTETGQWLQIHASGGK